MRANLARRALAEFLGTGLLVAVVVGSGIAAARLSTDHGVELFENAIVTALALPVLILVFGPVSGGHLNPVVSIADWLLGHRRRDGLSSKDLVLYVGVQTAGGIAGAVLANAMFDQAAGMSAHHRSGGHLWLGEVVATAGLLLVIFALARSGGTGQTPWAVGAYIGAAYWFTSSTAFANPAVTVGRMFSDSFAGIAPQSAPGFIGAQLAGAAVGLSLLAALYPHVDEVAGVVVVPRESTESSA
ncbi:MAG TPA: MIP/aquaporin family protein [Mycobacteriales bacterium]|jgi:arsenate reductase|nr:MIP/aquaporin family protein [Mycobacteriales bacterium]